jgi:hypothetical protein
MHEHSNCAQLGCEPLGNGERALDA